MKNNNNLWSLSRLPHPQSYTNRLYPRELGTAFIQIIKCLHENKNTKNTTGSYYTLEKNGKTMTK